MVTEVHDERSRKVKEEEGRIGVMEGLKNLNYAVFRVPGVGIFTPAGNSGLQ